MVRNASKVLQWSLEVMGDSKVEGYFTRKVCEKIGEPKLVVITEVSRDGYLCEGVVRQHFES